MPPIEQEIEVTTILCYLYPLFILSEIGNKKWLTVKISLEFLLLLYY